MPCCSRGCCQILGILLAVGIAVLLPETGYFDTFDIEHHQAYSWNHPSSKSSSSSGLYLVGTAIYPWDDEHKDFSPIQRSMWFYDQMLNVSRWEVDTIHADPNLRSMVMERAMTALGLSPVEEHIYVQVHVSYYVSRENGYSKSVNFVGFPAASLDDALALQQSKEEGDAVILRVRDDIELYRADCIDRMLNMCMPKYVCDKHIGKQVLMVDGAVSYLNIRTMDSKETVLNRIHCIASRYPFLETPWE